MVLDGPWVGRSRMSARLASVPSERLSKKTEKISKSIRLETRKKRPDTGPEMALGQVK